MPFRGFVAVEVGPRPPLVRLVERLAASGADLKTVAPENLHLTLKFLGQVSEDAVPTVAAALRAAAADEAPFVLRLSGTGTFPPRGAPRVWWVGVADGEPLVRIARRLDGTLASAGFPPETRPFAPHLTVARSRSAQGAERARAALLAEPVADEVRVEEVRLYRSDLAPAGPTYTVVASQPLGGAA